MQRGVKRRRKKKKRGKGERGGKRETEESFSFLYYIGRFWPPADWHEHARGEKEGKSGVKRRKK